MKHVGQVRVRQAQQFQKLEDVAKPFVDTRECAYYMNRGAETLRKWALSGDGLLHPVRIGRRLAWPVADIRRVLGVNQVRG